MESTAESSSCIKIAASQSHCFFLANFFIKSTSVDLSKQISVLLAALTAKIDLLHSKNSRAYKNIFLYGVFEKSGEKQWSVQSAYQSQIRADSFSSHSWRPNYIVW